MPADLTDISKMPTDGPAVNSPASGTYGEGAALERLRASFPTAPSAQGGAPAPSPMPTPPTGAGISSSPVGLPAGLALPTMQPNTPASTPMSAAPVNPALAAQTSRQRNLAILESLISDPSVSDATKEWATVVRGHLIQGSAR